MNHMKYIIVDGGFSGSEIPILFPFIIKHFDVSKGYVGEVVSAGFVCIDFADEKVNVWGKSTSLDKESRKEDAEIIKRELNRWSS